MITKVQLQNWRSHEQTELDFCEGTNALIGIMGAGKTSILDGICFALFGTFPALVSKKVKLEDVVMKKPKEKKFAEVNVFFELDDKEFSVKRRIENGRATGELRCEGKLIESPQTNKVTEEVEKILKINYDLFTRAVYSEQNQIDMFLTIPKGQRMKKIDEILAIDKFEKARLTTRSIVNKFSSTVSEKRELVKDFESGEELKNFPRMKKEIEELELERAKMEKNISAVRDKKQKAERSLSAMRETEKKFRELETEMKTSIALSRQFEEDIDRVKHEVMDYSEESDEQIGERVASIENDFLKMKAQIEEEREKISSLREIISSKETKVKLIDSEKIPEIKKHIKEMNELEADAKKHPLRKISAQLEQRVEELESHKEGAQTAWAQIKEVEESVREFESVGEVCPVCENELSERKKAAILEKKNERIRKLKSEITKHETGKDKMKIEIEKLKTELKLAERIEQRLSQLEGIEKQLKFVEDAKKQLRSEVSEHSNELKMAEKALKLADGGFEEKQKEFEKMKNVFDRRKEIQEKQKRLRELSQRIEQLQAQKGRFVGFAPEIIPAVEKEFQEAIGMEKHAEAKLEGLIAIISEKDSRISEVQNKMKILELHGAEIKKLEAMQNQLELLESGLEATQGQLRKNFVLAVNQAMGLLWQNLYPYKDFYSCRLAVEEGDYILQLQDATGWIPVDGVASGGERSLAALTLRIAFSLVLAPQLRWLVLDEPTHNLDAKAVEDLAIVLRDRISEFVEQVFLITHDPALENAVSGYLYRLERAKEKNEETRAIKVFGPEA
ncbi:MAG TPA: SMC family ATPase [archaeon]|nr:SMC family ATPase [archaeon]